MFKNRDGLIRSGWKIAVVIGFYYLILYLSVIPIDKITQLAAAHIGALTPSGGLTENFYNTYFLTVMIVQNIIMIAVPLFFWCILQKKTLSEMGFPPLKENKKNFTAGLLWGFVSFTLFFCRRYFKRKRPNHLPRNICEQRYFSLFYTVCYDRTCGGDIV